MRKHIAKLYFFRYNILILEISLIILVIWQYAFSAYCFFYLRKQKNVIPDIQGKGKNYEYEQKNYDGTFNKRSRGQIFSGG